MGTKQSRSDASSGPSSLAAATEAEKQAMLSGFDLSAPSAAVIGAGMSGVHAAYELANAGFRVTVFDKRDAVGMGDSTRFARPVVGLGNCTSAIWDVSLTRDLLRGVLPLGVPDIYSADYAYLSFFSSTVHRWMWARLFGGQALSENNRTAVQMWGQQLASDSADVVRNLSAKHATKLAPHVTPLRGIGIVGSPSEGAESTTKMVATSIAPAYPASKEPLLIDPVAWTNALATICRRELQVRFLLQHRVTTLVPNFRHGKEYVTHLHYQDGVDPSSGEDILRREKFDIVVLANGKDAADLTCNSVKVPVVGLRAFGLLLSGKDPMVRFIENVAHMTALGGGVGSSASAATAAHRYIDVLPRNSIALSPHTALPPQGSGDQRMLTGLFSFDTHSASLPTLKFVYERFASALRVAGGNLELPDPLRTVPVDGTSSDATVPPPEPFQFTRCFSPDGLPLISRAGNMFNCFVVSGFGDQVADYSPAAARRLVSLVVDPRTLQKEDVRLPLSENPFSLDRFPRLYKPVRPSDPSTLVENFTLRSEYQLMAWWKPIQQNTNRFMNDLARLDNMPRVFREFVFKFCYDEERDAELRAWAEKDASVDVRKPTPSTDASRGGKQ